MNKPISVLVLIGEQYLSRNTPFFEHTTGLSIWFSYCLIQTLASQMQNAEKIR